MTSKTPITDANVFPKDEFPSDVVVHPSVARDLEEKLTDTQAKLTQELRNASINYDGYEEHIAELESKLARARDELREHLSSSVEYDLVDGIRQLAQAALTYKELVETLEAKLEEATLLLREIKAHWDRGLDLYQSIWDGVVNFLASLEEGPWTKLDPATFIGIDPGKEDK